MTSEIIFLYTWLCNYYYHYCNYCVETSKRRLATHTYTNKFVINFNDICKNQFIQYTHVGCS